MINPLLSTKHSFEATTGDWNLMNWPSYQLFEMESFSLKEWVCLIAKEKASMVEGEVVISLLLLDLRLTRGETDISLLVEGSFIIWISNLRAAWFILMAPDLQSVVIFFILGASTI